jgi:TolA-binding protein
MTPMDLHPEDLIEREMRGELSAVEQDRLELHARQCAVCRLERRARVDFRAEAEGPGADADVARLLASMAAPLALQARQRAPMRSPMRYLRFVAAAAAVVTVTGFAAASRWSGVRAVILPWTAGPVETVNQNAPQATPARHPVTRAVAQVAPFAAPAAVTPEPAVAQAAVVDVVPAARVVAAAPAPLAHAALAHPAPASVPGIDAESSAAVTFRQANEARQMGDHLRAGELYGALLNRFPGSPEAHASLALFGRMLLDDGNSSGALQCFDDYLRTGGALREDVMLGRALAFQRIGPRAATQESQAWSALLDAYPGSVHAARARRRLFDLEGS